MTEHLESLAAGEEDQLEQHPDVVASLDVARSNDLRRIESAYRACRDENWGILAAAILCGAVPDYLKSFVPPPPPWPRFKPTCDTGFTPQQLDERRKCEILKYKGVRSGRATTTVSDVMTKRRQYVNAVRGRYLPKQSFAQQTQTTTNFNTQNNLIAGRRMIFGTAGGAPATLCLFPCTPFSASDIPRPPAGSGSGTCPNGLKEDPSVPLTRFFPQRSYAEGLVDFLDG